MELGSISEGPIASDIQARVTRKSRAGDSSLGLGTVLRVSYTSRLRPNTTTGRILRLVFVFPRARYEYGTAVYGVYPHHTAVGNTNKGFRFGVLIFFIMVGV